MRPVAAYAEAGWRVCFDAGCDGSLENVPGVTQTERHTPGPGSNRMSLGVHSSFHEQPTVRQLSASPAPEHVSLHWHWLMPLTKHLFCVASQASPAVSSNSQASALRWSQGVSSTHTDAVAFHTQLS